MNYLLKSSNFEEQKRAVRRKTYTIVLIIVLILFFLNFSPAKQILFVIAKPFWYFKNYIFSSDLFQYFKSKQILINEKNSLEQKLFLSGHLLAINETVQKENETLKDLFGRKNMTVHSILATILVRPPQIPYDLLIIDIGEDQGVTAGNKVIANGNVYLGEISESYKNTSKVSLYSTPGKKLSVVLGKNQVTVEAWGVGGGNFNIFLPKEIEVIEGDVITIPNIVPNFFGIVERINVNDRDSFQTVLFKSPINLSELSFVEVIIN